MTIEEHIKQAMAECPLTEQQEGKLLLGLENYLIEIEQVKNLNMPDVSKSLKCDCKHSGSCRYESVIIETKELCRHKE